jgi:hypothetical protein
MNNQFGGLKLIDKTKTGFTPIIDMVESENSNLSLLTYRSLKGFMISLNVDEEYSEYVGLKVTGRSSEFSNPVTSFILKFAVITENNDEPLPEYEKVTKASESKQSYYEEAKLQQHIWISSIIGSRPEICPPVANFSLFENAESKNLCSFFMSKSSGNLYKVFYYLLGLMSDNPTYGIGVIVMPKVEPSCTLGDVIYGQVTRLNGIKINLNEVYANVSAKIVRLFVEIGVIHFDLHAGNVLVFVTPRGEISTLIIDFGRASDILNRSGDQYLEESDKRTIIAKKGQFYNELLNSNESTSDQNKLDYMLNVLKYVANEDKEINQKMFVLSKSAYQMDWVENYPKTGPIPVESFDNLKTIATVNVDRSGLSRGTIQGYLRNGQLLNLEGRGIDVRNFITTFPSPTTQHSFVSSTGTASAANNSGPFSMVGVDAGFNDTLFKRPAVAPQPTTQQQQQCGEDQSNCIISGGKKRRRTKKNRKYKKIRKNRKSRKLK